MRSALLIVTGVVYLLLVFFYGVESPVFTIFFLAMAGHELSRLHRTGGRHP